MQQDPIVIEASGPFTSVGEVCEITREGGHGAVMAEVVGFREDRVLLMPLGEMQGIGPGSRVVMKGHVASIGSGTGSEFSVLPAQNANGNWVKVTQRVPVRIPFDKKPRREMIAGLSSDVTVRVRD